LTSKEKERTPYVASFREIYFLRKIFSSASKGKHLIWTIHSLSPTFVRSHITCRKKERKKERKKIV
jgi:hypothetical protein